MDVNYFDAQHMATNTINHQQIVNSADLKYDDILELLDNDTGEKTVENIEQYIRYKDEIETIPEESDEDFLVTMQGDGDDGDTILYIQGDSEEEQFNTAIDDTSDDPMIVMGKPLTTAFVSVKVRIPTEKVGCLQVTNQLREFLIHFPPDSQEKAFEQIYKILLVLNTYLIDNPQHIHCMSPDLCNFPAIWAVLSILLDTQSNTLQHVKSFQQVVNNYYDKCPTDVMSELEQQASIIMKAMYDSVNNEHSDSISGNIDRVSGAVHSDYDVNDYDKDENVMPYDKDENVMPYDKDENVMPYDKEKHEMPHDSDNEYMSDDNDDDQMPAKYDNDYETVIDEMKHDENMKSYEQIDVGKKDVVTYNRAHCIPTKEKRPIETKDIDDDFMREYYEMYKSMEHKQIRDYYEAWRHIQSAMEGDTPTKTSQNRQCIDNVRDYDREYDRILNSVRHTLDLGPNTLPGAQQYTTVDSAAALSIKEKFKGKYEDNLCNANGQYRNEWYKRAENMVPQLDGTYNVSDDSDLDLHSYLDLASSNIIVHRMQGQKQRYETDIRAHTSKRLAQKESTKPNMKGQKVPDDENIDINKIAQGDRPKGGRNTANFTAKQHKDKEAKRLVPEKVKRIQGQNDSKNTEAKRHMIEKAKIEALIEKHRLCTPKTPDEVNKLGTGKNAIEKGQEGTGKGKPPYKKATKDIQIKKSCKKGTEATNAKIGKTDTLLGDPMANNTTGIENEKGKGHKDKIDTDDIGIFEFIFKGLPELPELEGVDEDRLRDLQNAVQEQLCKRDEERERNITK